MENFFDGIDLLIQEASHVKPDEIFKFLSDKKPAKVLLTHFHPKLEGKEKFLLREAKNKASHTRVILAHDNMSMYI